MIRRIAVLTAIGVLALVATSAAAQSGNYSGMSKLVISGGAATHPFGLKVKHGKVVKVSLLAGANCSDVVLESGIKTSFKIKQNKFAGTIHVTGGSSVKVSGKFTGTKVKGSFSGIAQAGTADCSIPKNTYTATR
jgi:hypothetical protein